MNRDEMAAAIAEKLEKAAGILREHYVNSGIVQSCFIDNVFPVETARGIYDAFPNKESLNLKKTLREFKYSSAQMDKCQPILEDAVFAFQSPQVLNAVAKITGIEEMEPDPQLYAGGISLM